jgi:Na+-translocating ferredoxin:NAD+ oxidoreductase RnfG subunit
MGRRRIILTLALVALVAVALVGAVLQLVRGERPVLLAA